MERNAKYFSPEMAIREQRIRDAKLLIRSPGRLLREAEMIAAAQMKKSDRTVLDFN